MSMLILRHAPGEDIVMWYIGLLKPKPKPFGTLSYCYSIVSLLLILKEFVDGSFLAEYPVVLPLLNRLAVAELLVWTILPLLLL